MTAGIELYAHLGLSDACLSERRSLECEKEENETDRREREKRPKLREKKKPQKTLNSGGVGLFSDDALTNEKEQTF